MPSALSAKKATGRFRNKIKDFLKRSFDNGTQIGKWNILAAVYLGGSAHFFLYFIYKYFFGLYENIYIRFLTVFFCITVGFYYKLPEKIQKGIFPFYWHAMLIMALPFTLSVNLFKTNFHEAWLYWEIFMMVLLALYVPNWFIYIIDALIGIGGAFLFYLITTPDFNLTLDFDIFAYLIVFVFSGLAGMLFVYGNRNTWLEKQGEQYKALTAMAGSIVHEIRNPLSAINLASNSGIKTLKSSDLNYQEKMDKILEYKRNIVTSVAQANSIINIALDDLGNKSLTDNQFVYLKTDEVLPKIIAEYGYRNELEKERVKLDITEDNFIFKVIPERFAFIIYNLLKNALYYLKSYPNSTITIGFEERIIFNHETQEKRKFNSIFVYDTGPGISKDAISKLFDNFYTSGKKEGTGLGLAFCKRNMLLFGGDIICESEVAKNEKSGWTKFSMIFPRLTKIELQKAEKEIGKRKEKLIKILLVDDQRTILDTNRKILAGAFENIEFDCAKNGKEALHLFKYNNDYSMILTDIEMPIMNGFDLAKNIRKIDKEIPIISYSSINNNEIKLKFNKAGVDCYFSKPIKKRYLIRGVAKWNLANSIIHKTNIAKIQEEEIKEKIKILAQEKSVLIADDEMINLLLLKKALTDYGFKITSFTSSLELLNEYLKNPKKHDLIICDINLGEEMMGYDVAERIREYELKNNILNPIPIIAYSGDGEQEKVFRFFRSGMTDYFIKGVDDKILIEKVIFYLELDKKINNEKEEKVDQDIVFDDITKLDINFFKNIPLIIDHLDDKLLKEVSGVFIEDSELLLKQIRKSFAKKNIKDFYFYSHSLKGVAGNVGAKRLCEFVTYLNEFAKNKKFPDLQDWFKELEEIFKDTKQAILLQD